MRLALVHDWLNTLGGAERVLIELHRMYPGVPIYTLFYNKKFIKQWLPDAKIHASFLQKVPFITKIYPKLAWLMPVAIESFNLSGYDTVLSSSVAFSKGLVLKPSTKHICYCYSPTRQLWDNTHQNKESTGRMIAKHFLRIWDLSAADRVDQFVAISKTVQARIKKYYNKDSIVIYPPTNPANFQRGVIPERGPQSRGIEMSTTGVRMEQDPELLNLPKDFYLIVSRLYDYKNIDVAIQAFNKIGYSLIIIGDGPLRHHLQRKANKNITFLRSQDDSTVAAHYAACRAFIMPQEEDFGLTAVEAMSFGKPVVALRKGGATETVVEGVTGEFFDDPIPEAIADALTRLNAKYDTYDLAAIKNQTDKFSLDNFKKEITNLLQS